MARNLNAFALNMKNYLLYPDCFTEDSINRCRFALLKLLGHYNLTPPANISVLIHTNKAAAFEIFDPFFSEITISEKAAPAAWNDWQTFRSLLADLDDNVLVCRSAGYLKKPVEPLFQKIAEGLLLYCTQQQVTGTEKPNDHFFEKTFAVGINTTALQNPSTSLYTTAQNSSHYFTTYRNRNEVNALLKLFFLRNEEESAANLVKKAKGIDLEAVEMAAAAEDNLPFYKRWLHRLWGKNSVWQRYQNKV